MFNFHESWEGVFRIFGAGVGLYVGLICLLRITGNRTLSQFNTFDFIVTIAMGSTLSAAMMQKDTSMSEGMAGLAFLVFAQFTISKLNRKSERFKSLVTTDPVLLFYNGRFLEENMAKARILKEEALAYVRQQGAGTFDQVETIILETNGKLSVVMKGKGGERISVHKDIKSYKDISPLS